jgi:hypothetical protein
MKIKKKIKYYLKKKIFFFNTKKKKIFFKGLFNQKKEKIE